MAQQRKSGGAMTVAEAGRMGGRLVREKYGLQHFERIGRKGGQKVADLIARQVARGAPRGRARGLAEASGR